MRSRRSVLSALALLAAGVVVYLLIRGCTSTVDPVSGHLPMPGAGPGDVSAPRPSERAGDGRLNPAQRAWQRYVAQTWGNATLYQLNPVPLTRAVSQPGAPSPSASSTPTAIHTPAPGKPSTPPTAASPLTPITEHLPTPASGPTQTSTLTAAGDGPITGLLPTVDLPIPLPLPPISYSVPLIGSLSNVPPAPPKTPVPSMTAAASPTAAPITPVTIARRPDTGGCFQGQLIDGQTWNCTFDDEFNDTALDRSKWVVNTGFVTGNPHGGTYGCALDDPAAINESSGALHLVEMPWTSPVACNGYAATSIEAPTISTWGGFSQQYGRVEIRAKVTASTVPGLQESFWMWPDTRYGTDNNWPSTGEIDIAELYSVNNTLGIPFLHYTQNDNGGPVDGLNTAWNCAADRGVWNDYTMVWTATSIAIDINGVPCLTNTSGDQAFNKRYILMLSQALGLGNNAMQADTTFPASTDVDYVRVWAAS